MSKRFLLLVGILATAGAKLGCGSSGQRTCPGSMDGGGGDLGTGPEARPCRRDDYYVFWMPMHMSADRTIGIRSLKIVPGWNGRCGNSSEMVGRLLAEDGTILGACGDPDLMLCAGKSCPPHPYPVDSSLAIQMVPGAAFYEYTDTVSGQPPIRIDLRGHVQLFCMNAPCELDVCKRRSLDAGNADVSERDGATTAGGDADVES